MLASLAIVTYPILRIGTNLRVTEIIISLPHIKTKRLGSRSILLLVWILEGLTTYGELVDFFVISFSRKKCLNILIHSSEECQWK